MISHNKIIVSHFCKDNANYASSCLELFWKCYSENSRFARKHLQWSPFWAKSFGFSWKFYSTFQSSYSLLEHQRTAASATKNQVQCSFWISPMYQFSSSCDFQHWANDQQMGVSVSAGIFNGNGVLYAKQVICKYNLF